MSLAAALIYWLIIALWLSVLATVALTFIRNPSIFGAARLLLSVVVIDTVRNIFENLYFGLYFGSQYGLFPASIVGTLDNPTYLILPKVMNVIAAAAVLGLLLFRWLPSATKERIEAASQLKTKTDALNQESEERRRLFDTSLDLILIADRTGFLQSVNPSSMATLGYKPHEMIGRNGAEFIHADDLEPTRHEIKLVRAGRQTRNFETRFIHKSRRPVPIAWSGVWSEPEQKHFFIGRDMTERKAAEDQLRRLALFDQLTGLPNRSSLQADLTEDNLAPGITIVVLDLDLFKDVNDTLGHPVGDKLLQGVARRLTAFASNARVYRTAEDDFVLALPNCGDPLVASNFVNAALNEITRPFDLDGVELFMTASAGIAIAPAHGSNFNDLLANAELALFAAKAAGGRCYRLYVPTFRARAAHRRELDTELRRACKNQEFVLHFQPQVRSGDGAVVGAEALIRWQHPERGILPPGAFIDALCENVTAVEVSRWILATACATAVSWRAKGLPLIRMGINLFPVQFHCGSLLQDVEHTLARSGLPPDALELEITENIALGREERTLSSLKALRASGVGVAFDDFGTGYASLSYLTRYPLSRIKIDRSFIQSVGGDSAGKDAAIVRSIIAMGRHLGVELVAEGVETVAQAEFLRVEGCHELQGFLFSKPLPADAFEQYLRSNMAATHEVDPWTRRSVG